MEWEIPMQSPPRRYHGLSLVLRHTKANRYPHRCNDGTIIDILHSTYLQASLPCVYDTQP